MLKLFTLTLKVSNKIAILLYKYTKKKSLKIPKGLSEVINQRRTDNTMTKSKRTNKICVVFFSHFQIKKIEYNCLFFNYIQTQF
jgi:hypothetical protein